MPDTLTFIPCFIFSVLKVFSSDMLYLKWIILTKYNLYLSVLLCIIFIADVYIKNCIFIYFITLLLYILCLLIFCFFKWNHSHKHSVYLSVLLCITFIYFVSHIYLYCFYINMNHIYKTYPANMNTYFGLPIVLTFIIMYQFILYCTLTFASF